MSGGLNGEQIKLPTFVYLYFFILTNNFNTYIYIILIVTYILFSINNFN